MLFKKLFDITIKCIFDQWSLAMEPIHTYCTIIVILRFRWLNLVHKSTVHYSDAVWNLLGHFYFCSFSMVYQKRKLCWGRGSKGIGRPHMRSTDGWIHEATHMTLDRLGRTEYEWWRVEKDGRNFSIHNITRSPWWLDGARWRRRWQQWWRVWIDQLDLSAGINDLKRQTSLCLFKMNNYFICQDNVEDAHLVQLFDPVISPRCYAIVSIKNHTVDL